MENKIIFLKKELHALTNVFLLSRFCLSYILSVCLFIKRPVSFFKWANPGLFFISFCLFKHTLQFLQQINVKKCPSSIWCRDWNSRPLEHKSLPITTRPGLPPNGLSLYLAISVFLFLPDRFSCNVAKPHIQQLIKYAAPLNVKSTFSTFFLLH